MKSRCVDSLVGALTILAIFMIGGSLIPSLASVNAQDGMPWLQDDSIRQCGLADPVMRSKILSLAAQDREATVRKLVEIVHAHKGDKPDPQVTGALLLLGEIRAIEAIDTIIGRLDYSGQSAGMDNPLALPDFRLVWPARTALHKMGPIVVEHLLEALRTQKLESVAKRKIAIVLVGLLTCDGAILRIKRYCKGIPETERSAVECKEVQEVLSMYEQRGRGV